MVKRIVKIENHRVEVTPDEWLVPKQEGPERNECLRVRCADIAQSIKRHVDGIRGVATTCDTVDVCSGCGRQWETETDDGVEICVWCGEPLEEQPPIKATPT